MPGCSSICRSTACFHGIWNVVIRFAVLSQKNIVSLYCVTALLQNLQRFATSGGMNTSRCEDFVSGAFSTPWRRVRLMFIRLLANRDLQNAERLAHRCEVRCKLHLKHQLQNEFVANINGAKRIVEISAAQLADISINPDARSAFSKRIDDEVLNRYLRKIHESS